MTDVLGDIERAHEARRREQIRILSAAAYVPSLCSERTVLMTDPTPTPTPAPAPAQPSKATVVLHDARVILGGVVAACEAVLVSLPTGPIHDAFQIGIPIAASVVMALVNLGG